VEVIRSKMLSLQARWIRAFLRVRHGTHRFKKSDRNREKPAMEASTSTVLWMNLMTFFCRTHTFKCRQSDGGMLLEASNLITSRSIKLHCKGRVYNHKPLHVGCGQGGPTRRKAKHHPYNGLRLSTIVMRLKLEFYDNKTIPNLNRRRISN